MFLWGINADLGRNGDNKSGSTMAILEINVYKENKGVEILK